MSRYNRLIKQLQSPAPRFAPRAYPRRPRRRHMNNPLFRSAATYSRPRRFAPRAVVRGMASRGRSHKFKNPGGKAKDMVEGPPTLLDKIASGVGSVAKLATAISPMLAMINTELKYSDSTATVTTHTPGTNNSLVCLTQCDQGTTSITRIGDSILVQDLQIRFAINFATTTTIVGAYYRILIFCWKDDASANPPLATAANILESNTNIFSPLDKDFSDQIVILKDKHIAINASVIPTTGTLTTAFHMYKWFKKINWHVRFSGTTGSTFTTNHIYMLIQSTGTSTNTVGTTYYSRMNFTDN